MPDDPDTNRSKDEAAKFDSASDSSPLPLWKEFLQFLVQKPWWWLVPLLLVTILLVLAVVMLPTESLPFIYRL